MENKKKEEHLIKRHILNESIRAKQVRLIGKDSTQIGIKSIEEALSIAKQDDLDLLLVSPDAKPPVCKIIDFGQFLYEQKKKDKIAKKSNKGQIIKEVKLSPNISEHDYQVRLKRAKVFLNKKYKVKISLFFKGRQITHPELGMGIMNRFIEEIAEIGTPESAISRTGKILSVTINAK